MMNFPSINWKPAIRARMEPYRRSELVRGIIARDGTDCHWCGCETFENAVDGRQPPDCRTLDHVVARALGGADSLKNTVIACCECNQRRGAEDQFTVEWRRMHEMAPNRIFGCFVTAAGEAT